MIKVEIWSDINCPFCYIAKKHFELALNTFEAASDVIIDWKSFELDPETIPSKSFSSLDLLAMKYGRDRTWAQKMFDSITVMAKQAGLEFQLSKMIAANTYDCHRLMAYAKTTDKENEVIEKLFSFKFIEGKDVGDKTVLREAAIECGLDFNRTLEVLMSDQFGSAVRADEAKAKSLGINAVPAFLFNKQLSLSGAQPVDVFLKTLKQAGQFQFFNSAEF